MKLNKEQQRAADVLLDAMDTLNKSDPDKEAALKQLIPALEKAFEQATVTLLEQALHNQNLDTPHVEQSIATFKQQLIQDRINASGLDSSTLKILADKLAAKS